MTDIQLNDRNTPEVLFHRRENVAGTVSGTAPANTIAHLVDKKNGMMMRKLEAIRCTLPSCRCDCFQPGKVHVRTCETCKHGWVAHALDKLGFRSIYQMGLQVEVVQPSVVFDIASLMLYGSQATPIRLKILLDRLFSVLQHEEVLQVLHGFGWAYEDYARGYILQDAGGHVLDKWNLCTREEEQVILQQFLRFGETKAIAQEIILQDARETHSRHLISSATSESEIKKFLERSTAQATETNNTSPVTTTASSTPPRSMEMRYPIRPFPGFGIMPNTSKLFGGAVGLAGFTVPNMTKTSPTKGQSAMPSAGPGSPLSKLQTMQPFDYRRDRASPTFSPGAVSEKSVPTTPAGSTSPQNLSLSSVGSMVSPPISNSNPRINSKENGTKVEPSPAKSMDMPYKDYGLPLDFSVKENSCARPVNVAPRTSMPYDDHKSRSLRKNVPTIQRRNYSPTPGYGGTLVSPSGKKRVLCTACNKTFCDKGALKIHYSAVHLKEMHKCSVDGCNMMFSSRRSRNRHSANPNPKLHMPQNRRKLPDGAVVLDENEIPPHLPTSLPQLMQPSGPIAMTSSAIGSSPMEIKPIAVMPIHFTDMPHLAALKNHMSFGDRSDMPMLAKFPRMDLLNEPNSFNFPKPKDDESSSGQINKPEHSSSQRSSSKRKSVMPTRCAQIEDVYVMSDENSLDGMSMGETISEEDDPMLGSMKSQSSPDRLSQEEDVSRCSSVDAMENDREKEEHFIPVSSAQNSPRHVNNDHLNKADHDKANDEEDIVVSDVYSAKEKHYMRNHHSKPIGLDGVYEEALDMSTSKPVYNNRMESIEEFIENGRRTPNEEGDHKDDEFDDDEDDDDEEGMVVDIPVDKDDPKKCPACGKIFQNHFTVRTHYQNVHLKLMHTCTVEGCNAAFPSKRSRDRHSSNLNLHRKLLSTSSVADGKIGHKNSADQSLRDEFLARIYDNQHLPAAYAGALHPEYAALLAAGNGLQGLPDEMARLSHKRKLEEEEDHQEIKSEYKNEKEARVDEENDKNLRQKEKETNINGAVTQLVNNNTHYNNHTSDCEKKKIQESMAFGHQNHVDKDRRMVEEENDEERRGSYDMCKSNTCQNGELDLSFEHSSEDGPVEDPEGDADCHICGMRFRDNLVLKEHFEKVHPKEMYHCTIQGCDKIFSTRKSRNRHSQNDNLHRQLPTAATGLV